VNITTDRILEQGEALIRAIETVKTIEPIRPVERVQGWLLLRAYRRRFRGRVTGSARSIVKSCFLFGFVTTNPFAKSIPRCLPSSRRLAEIAAPFVSIDQQLSCLCDAIAECSPAGEDWHGDLPFVLVLPPCILPEGNWPTCITLGPDV
jgi:hypothetical protein